jgi:hypothetical protein
VPSDGRKTENGFAVAVKVAGRRDVVGQTKRIVSVNRAVAVPDIPETVRWPKHCKVRLTVAVVISWRDDVRSESELLGVYLVIRAVQFLRSPDQRPKLGDG